MTNEDSAGIHQANSGLASDERETLRVALAMGYFEVPREATLVDLAEAIGRSDVAVTREIRRGTGTVLRETGALDSRA